MSPPYSGISSLPTKASQNNFDWQRSSSPTPCSKKNQMSMGNTRKKHSYWNNFIMKASQKEALEQFNLLLGEMPTTYWKPDCFCWIMEQPVHRKGCKPQISFSDQWGAPLGHNYWVPISHSFLSYQKNPTNYTGVIWAYLCSECIK